MHGPGPGDAGVGAQQVKPKPTACLQEPPLLLSLYLLFGYGALCCAVSSALHTPHMLRECLLGQGGWGR